jgi:hypothetical protein
MFCLIFMALVTTGCGSDGRYQGTLITNGTHTLAGDILGDLILLGGEATLDQAAILRGSIHQFSGTLHLDGEVHGEASFLGGQLILGPDARIGGDLNYGGGELTGLNQAAVAGQVNTGTGLQIPSIAPQQQSLIGTLFRWLIGALLMGLLSVVLWRYLPKHVERVSQVGLHHAGVSTAMGILVGIVGISLLVFLAYTIILIPVALLGILLMGAAIYFGWISFGIALGRFASKHLLRSLQPGARAFWGAFVFALLLNILTIIPFLGSILGIFTAILGLGAVYLTRYGTRHFEPEYAGT